MQARSIALIFVGALLSLCTDVESQAPNRPAGSGQCVSMHDNAALRKFASCSAAGYNNTFPLNEGISERSRYYMLQFFKWLMPIMKNCSQNHMAEALFCSWFVPKCVSTSPTPILPCRRVCSEFLKQCLVDIEELYFDIIIGMCEILPNKTASSGKCLEPTGFKVNASVPDPLLRPCQPLVIPACQGKGYTHTLLHSRTQKEFYRMFYGSNFTKENASKELPPFLERSLNKYPKCRLNLERHFCAWLFPPCFPPELAAYYTLCKSGCQEVLRDCPGLVDDPSMHFTCDHLAEGTSSHGFCKHKVWPNPDHWIAFMEGPTPSPSPTPRKGASAGVIAAAVLVPVVFIGIIIGGMFIWKRRGLLSNGFKYGKQQDDMEPLDT